jgi:subtilisin family serine protease
MRKICLLVALGVAAVCHGQQPNWQNLDLKKDSVMGISTERAYLELLKGKKAAPVIVAVIDCGIDTNHEDLKAVLWTNPKETRNGKDDDQNGYADDRHGWNFIGSAKDNVLYDNTELVREVRIAQPRFEGKDSTAVPAKELPAFRLYKKQKAELDQKLSDAQKMLNGITAFNQILENMTKKMGKADPAMADFESYQPIDQQEDRIKTVVLSNLKTGMDFKLFKAVQIDDALKHYRIEVGYHYNIAFDPRKELVGDNYVNSNERYYGNADISGPEPDHGTHVAGIIGAERDNNMGIKGVADHVLLMGVRVVPDGDERDKDIANAIRYATDNGAKVINMSFGEDYSFDKNAVDDAVKYAMSKDVLIVHAAGNDDKNLDKEDNFPNRVYADKSGTAGAWIEVGASGFKDDENLKAVFSNYGKTRVDVFAPGVAIYSCVPVSKYEAHDGTSMAAPMVAGLAALIFEYYPKLTAVQVKDIILNSVVRIDHQVNLPGKAGTKSVRFSELCNTGGIVNAYRALQLAEQYKQGKGPL